MQAAVTRRLFAKTGGNFGAGRLLLRGQDGSSECRNLTAATHKCFHRRTYIISYLNARDLGPVVAFGAGGRVWRSCRIYLAVRASRPEPTNFPDAWPAGMAMAATQSP